MKEPIMSFYLIPCKLQNEKGVFRTEAFKYGIGDDAQERLKTVRTEFKKYYRVKHQINDGKSGNIELDFEMEIQLEGPKSFIKGLEDMIGLEFFASEERYFKITQQNSSEYVLATMESIDSYRRLVDVLRKHEPAIKSRKASYDQIDAQNQNSILNDYHDLFVKMIEDIRSHLKLPPKPQNITSPVGTALAPTTSPAKRSIWDNMVQDFTLFKKGNKYYLQNNAYHAGKQPTDYQGAFTVDTTNPNSEKFQWDQNSWMRKNFREGQATWKRVVALFEKSGKVIDLDLQNLSKTTNHVSNIINI